MRRIQEFVPSVVYNWSAGVQRDVGWGLVADAAYVGNAARRQPITRELNGRPYGYRFQPSSLDPTNVIPSAASRSLSRTICCARTAATRRSHSGSSPATPTTIRCSCRRRGGGAQTD